MKKFVFIYIVFLFLLVSPTFSLEACAESTEPIEDDVQKEFQQEQFLVQIQNNGNKEMVKLYLFIIDHSVYNVNVSTWNAFCKNYKNCLYAYRAYRQGWNVQFDDLL